ncbi:putative inorganic phosphate cotransporter [Thrips palmi]|uniref:Inorganic phosphate cotransporter n=1 Tax=Thrips palmi TaxID=161013 RepID=A0A6P9A9T2_THRPL|nr:putative inorganic phosphate cotransporter [Thrips palmi]
MPQPSNAHVRISPPRKRLGVRHLQACLMALVSFVAYALRANLSVAVVAMVRTRPRNQTALAAALLNETSLLNGSVVGLAGEGMGGDVEADDMMFDWDEKVRGGLLSAFFWGYMISQVPGGILSQQLGGSRLLAGALITTSLCTLLLPVCALQGGWKAVFANRVLQGFTQGPVYPSVYTLLGVWVPPHEREIFTTVVLGSQLLGPMLASPLCGVIAARWGWPSIFYSFGVLGLATGVLLLSLGADRPSKHSRISAEELAYIESCINDGEAPKMQPRTPWLAVISSPCVWVLWLSLSVQAMVFFTFLTSIPTYLNGVLGFSLEENGLLTSLPYLTGFLSSFFFTWMANWIRDRKLLSTTNSRKLFNAMANVPISVCVVATAYVSSKAASVALICLSMGFYGPSFVGVQANYLDLAPLHTGPIYSVGNMMAAVLGVLGPQVVGLIVSDVTDITQWRIVFWAQATVLLTVLMLYTWLGSGKEQPWNHPDYNHKRKRNLNIQEELGPVSLQAVPLQGSRTSLSASPEDKIVANAHIVANKT